MPQSDESVRLEMPLSKDEMELVQRAREILGHLSPGMSWKELFVFMARDLIKRKDPAREVRARAHRPSQGQDKYQNGNRNQGQNQRQNHSQRRSQSQSNNPNEIQEQGRGDTTLLKPPGLGSENGNFDDTTQIPLGSPELASADLVLSSGLHCRASVPDLAPSLELIPTPTKTPTLEHRSSATLARWVNLSSLRSEAELLGSKLPRVELSGAEDMRLSARSKTKAITSSSVPAPLRRLVFRRDQRCQWFDHFTGRKCGIRHLLALDHIQPRRVGGLDEHLNLRLLCRSHNSQV